MKISAVVEAMVAVASMKAASCSATATVSTSGRDKAAALSLGLYIVPRGKDTKPDWILAANEVDARRGADLFFGKAVIVAKPRQEDRPSIGARVLVQIPKRDSQPDHLGFIFEEWSKEHAQALAAV